MEEIKMDKKDKKYTVDKGFIADMCWRLCITLWVIVHTIIV